MDEGEWTGVDEGDGMRWTRGRDGVGLARRLVWDG